MCCKRPCELHGVSSALMKNQHTFGKASVVFILLLLGELDLVVVDIYSAEGIYQPAVGDMASFSDVNSDVNKDKMADTYAKILQNDHDNELSQTKPVFLLESDVFGIGKPSKTLFLFHKELYNAVKVHLPPSHLKGLQRVRGLWRLYADNQDDRDKLLVKGLVIRGKQVNLYSRNPRVAMHENPNYIRIRVKDVPCSADDGQITRYLEKSGCIIHNMHRECLRIDGFLTNCQTGDRIYMCDPPVKPLPRYTVIGKYKAAIFYRGQTVENKPLTCNKCLEQGHMMYTCPNDWKCRQCHKSGHKQSQCDELFDATGEQDNQSNVAESDPDMSSSEDEDSADDTHDEDAYM